MDVIKSLEWGARFIESHLTEPFEPEKLGRASGMSADGFGRLFCAVTGMTVREYKRRRQLTAAAFDLRDGMRVIDVAVKYGWDSGDAFARAFRKQHGVTPTEARDPSVTLMTAPSLFFHISVKGAELMRYREIELQELVLYGLSKPWHREMEREELRHAMWDTMGEDYTARISEGRWNDPEDSRFDGAWYGVWHDGMYMVAREENPYLRLGLEKIVIPAGRYHVFESDKGGHAHIEIPKLWDFAFEEGFDSFRPIPCDPVVEIYHLWADRERRQKERYYEILARAE